MIHRRSYGNKSSESAEINMSPLVDMVFLLLIFFIVTTTFIEETGVEVQRPTAASAQRLERESILIAVTREGRVVYGGREIGINGVRGVVSHLLKEGGRPVIIIADELSPSGIVVSVIDESKLAGAEQISIAADRK